MKEQLESLINELIKAEKLANLRPENEVIIKRLQSIAPLYSMRNPFHKGDIVHPRKNSVIKGHGLPHLVIDVNYDASPDKEGFGTPRYGMRPTIRVLTFYKDGLIAPVWHDHAEFELWRWRCAEDIPPA